MNGLTMREVAARVRARRRELRLTQAELAVRAGVTRNWVVAFEAGRGNPTVEVLLRLLASIGLGMVITDDREIEVSDSGQGVDLDAIIERLRE